MRMRTTIGLAALAGLAACALNGARADAAPIAAEELRPGVVREVRLSPGRPRVGDSVWIAAVLVNRGPEPFEFTDSCHDDTYRGNRLPLVPPPDVPRARPPGGVSPDDFTCLGITHRTVLPGDTAVLSERHWGPLTRPGTFPLPITLHYGPRAALDTLTVMLTVRPRR